MTLRSFAFSVRDRQTWFQHWSWIRWGNWRCWQWIRWWKPPSAFDRWEEPQNRNKWNKRNEHSQLNATFTTTFLGLYKWEHNSRPFTWLLSTFWLSIDMSGVSLILGHVLDVFAHKIFENRIPILRIGCEKIHYSFKLVVVRKISAACYNATIFHNNLITESTFLIGFCFKFILI